MRRTSFVSRLTVFAGLLVAAESIVLAQEDAAVPETMDEIVVTGKLRLDQLRLQLYESEIDVYDIYNDLNDDNEFDVLCANEAPTGTHIKQRYCEPRFVKNLRQDALRDRNSTRISKSQYRRKSEEMATIMEMLANNNPELLQALIDYSEAADRYDAAYDDDCKGDVEYCDE